MNNQKSTSSQLDRQYDPSDQFVVIDGVACKHKFIMKGFKNCECLQCGVGVFVNSIDEFKSITKKCGIIK